jgi:RNA polymerase sigma factor (sigma-70 family)
VVINDFILFIYNNQQILLCIRRRLPSDLKEDFLHYLIEIISKMNVDKLTELYIRNELINYTIGIIYNQIGKGGKYRKEMMSDRIVRLDDELLQMYDNRGSMVNVLSDEEYDETIDNKINEMEAKLSKIESEDMILFKMKYNSGLSYRKISAITGINLKTIERRIRKIKKQL